MYQHLFQFHLVRLKHRKGRGGPGKSISIRGPMEPLQVAVRGGNNISIPPGPIEAANSGAPQSMVTRLVLISIPPGPIEANFRNGKDTATLMLKFQFHLVRLKHSRLLTVGLPMRSKFQFHLVRLKRRLPPRDVSIPPGPIEAVAWPAVSISIPPGPIEARSGLGVST